jgi:hypothetical protein
MPEHDDSIAVVMWEATVTGRRLIDEMVNLGSFCVAQEEKAGGHDFKEYFMDHSTWHRKRKQKGTISTSTSCRMASYR